MSEKLNGSEGKEKGEREKERERGRERKGKKEGLLSNETGTIASLREKTEGR